jgi:hypothetical protein
MERRTHTQIVWKFPSCTGQSFDTGIQVKPPSFPEEEGSVRKTLKVVALEIESWGHGEAVIRIYFGNPFGATYQLNLEEGSLLESVLQNCADEG